MPDLTEHNRFIDASVAAFETHAEIILRRAQADVLAQLQLKLDIQDGVVQRTANNQRILRNVDTLFERAMSDAGYDGLVTAFVSQFPGMLPLVDEILVALKLPPMQWATGDQALLSSFQLNAAAAIESAVTAAAGTAMTRAVFAVGGLTFEKLVASLMEAFDLSVAKAKTLADTAQTTFYRTAQDRAFQAIEADPVYGPQRYQYSTSPRDKKNRPFCRLRIDQTLAGKSWTRAEIQAMDNGSVGASDVMTACGGWGCRHVWLLSV